MATAAGRRLAAGLAVLGVNATDSQQSQLLEYLSLLERWNASFNLTAVRDPLQMVDRHLLDSLSILEFVPADGSRVVDVGTGGGLPGVPLAIMRPENHFDLLDSNGKKTRFLFQVKTALGLDNMAVRHERAEAWNPDAAFELVLSRAFASLPDMVRSCAHLCAPGGRLLAMKGQLPEQELAELETLDRPVSVTAIHKLDVPGLEEERHLVELRLEQERQQDDATGENLG